jgi:hypothetical protein
LKVIVTELFKAIPLDWSAGFMEVTCGGVVSDKIATVVPAL